MWHEVITDYGIDSCIAQEPIHSGRYYSSNLCIVLHNGKHIAVIVCRQTSAIRTQYAV